MALIGKRVLITTYTNENIDQIRSYIIERCGHVPSNIKLLSWFSFLLQDGVRPYQSMVTSRTRIDSILFENLNQRAKFTSKSNIDEYFFPRSGLIYRDRVSDFVCVSDENTGGAVIKRLEKTYDQLFIDEMQDLAGYDFNFLEKIFRSTLPVTAVGDPRQGTYSTNNSGKNKRFKRSGILEWIKGHNKSGVISIIEKNECYRCNQEICDFADKLFPDFRKTVSMNEVKTGHDGVFKIKADAAKQYYLDYQPVVLRWNKDSDTLGLPAINIGQSKGRSYTRVLIFPTAKMKSYLASSNIKDAGDISKLYVAVTRARYSVAFVT